MHLADAKRHHDTKHVFEAQHREEAYPPQSGQLFKVTRTLFIPIQSFYTNTIFTREESGGRSALR